MGTGCGRAERFRTQDSSFGLVGGDVTSERQGQSEAGSLSDRQHSARAGTQGLCSSQPEAHRSRPGDLESVQCAVMTWARS
eukprot:227035-Rhodomonas_salina.1